MSTEPTPVDEKKTYYGNCRCGVFKFRLVIPKLKEVTECNCRICFKKGYKWVFPGEGGFIVDKGEGKLREYNFGPHTMSHCFCPTCGSGILGKRHGVPAAMEYGINVCAHRLFDSQFNTATGTSSPWCWCLRPENQQIWWSTPWAKIHPTLIYGQRADPYHRV